MSSKRAAWKSIAAENAKLVKQKTKAPEPRRASTQVDTDQLTNRAARRRAKAQSRTPR